MAVDQQAFGFVADVGGTNTRLGRVNAAGVVAETVVTQRNADFQRFDDMAQAYLEGQATPTRMVVAVAGPVMGEHARLTNRNWGFDTRALCASTGARDAHLINDLEALGAAVSSVADTSVEPLHDGARLGGDGQALVVGLGTGFNVASVDTGSGVVFSAEAGHASLPATVADLLSSRVPGAERFRTVEDLFSGPGFLHLAQCLGLPCQSAADVAQSDDPRAAEAIDIAASALAVLLQELAYMYFPRAGIFLNGSLAQQLVSPATRAQVLALLHEDTRFDGQFAKIPVFRFTSDSVALGGCAAALLRRAGA